MDNCEHKYIHLETRYIKTDSSHVSNTYKRIERFFCEKCCEEKVIKKEECRTYIPEWFKYKDCETERD